MTQDEFNELSGDDDPVEIVWSRMTVRLPGGRVLVFYEDGGTLVSHEFTIHGEG